MDIYQSSYPNEPLWQESEQLLYVRACEAISRFTADHANTSCSFFAFYPQTDYTSILIALDTPSNAIEKAKQREQQQILRRTKNLSQPHAWRYAAYDIGHWQIHAHSSSTGEFEFRDYAQLELEGWEEFLESFLIDLPSESAPTFEEAETKACKLYEEYVKGHTVLIFWRIIERLIADGQIQKIALSTPFRLGYQFHDDPVVTVVRVLNWPQIDSHQIAT